MSAAAEKTSLPQKAAMKETINENEQQQRKAAEAESARPRRRKKQPQDLLKLYEAKGVSKEEAPLRAIADLQDFAEDLIERLKAESSHPNSAKRVQQLNARLTAMEMKIDSKPGPAQAFAIGVVASAAANAVPQIFSALGGTFSAISASMKRN